MGIVRDRIEEESQKESSVWSYHQDAIVEYVSNEGWMKHHSDEVWEMLDSEMEGEH